MDVLYNALWSVSLLRRPKQKVGEPVFFCQFSFCNHLSPPKMGTPSTKMKEQNHAADPFRKAEGLGFSPPKFVRCRRLTEPRGGLRSPGEERQGTADLRLGKAPEFLPP